MYLCISCIFTYTYRVKLGNRCALKLEKATEVSFTRFFSCYLSSKVPYGQGCIKTQAYRSKFNSGVKMIKKSQHNDYLLKKLFVAHFFSIIVHQFFWLHKNYQICAIIKNYIAHDLSITAHSYFVFLYTKETWMNIQKPFQTTNADLDSPWISKMELCLTIINGFY